MEVKLLPYCTIDGVPTFRDSEIGYLYTMLEKAGRAKDFFCDGIVLSKEDFIQRMKDERMWVFSVDNKIKGIVCLTDFRQATAMTHYAFFKTERNTLKIAKEVRRQLIYMKDNDGNCIFSVLLGITPSKNERAIRFAAAFGCKKLCKIPDYFYDEADECYYDGILWSTTREEKL